MAYSNSINYSGIFLSWYHVNDTKCVHTNVDHNLIYLYSGRLVIEEENKETVINPGECVFVRRNHRVKMNKLSFKGKEYKGITMAYKRNVLRDFYNNMDKKAMPKDVKMPEKSIFKISLRPDITSLFQSLTPYFDSSVLPTEEVIKLKEQEGILALLNTDKNFFPVLFDFTEPWKIDILDFLNENYMDDLTMEEIAAFTGRSLSTFKRDFSKISDLTPQKWIINRRLEVAYNKLQNENKKVVDVSTEVGFKNLSHFYAAFKRQYGFSPRR